MSIEKSKVSARCLIALFTAALMLTVIVLPSADVSAAERLTVPDVRGMDGIDGDEHNSYAWCGAVFPQTQEDDGTANYLWVGTNRDAGGNILLLSGYVGDVDPRIYDVLGIPEPSADKAGKIYRFNLDDPEAEWELMYQNPAFSGWRKMVVFDGDLYVFAGITNRAAHASYQYAAVYRFGADFAPGDQPEVVHWVRLPAITAESAVIECYRSAFVYNDKLYLSMFDGKIYSTDGPSVQAPLPTTVGQLAAYPPGTPPIAVGWELVADLGLMAGGVNIWDITMFNDNIYAFVSGAGFEVYKLSPPGEGETEWNIDLIVGGDGTGDELYPAGLGIRGHVTASPFISKQFEEEYVYVTTFANGPALMTAAGAGKLQTAFDNYYTPATIYRFNADDEWEVIVGDTTGNNIAVDRNGDPVPHIGNMRAGFYPSEKGVNTSANLYIWQMAEYEGRLYAATWDVGVFRKAIPVMVAGAFAQSLGPAAIDDITNATVTMYTALEDLSNTLLPIMADYAQAAEDIGSAFASYGMSVAYAAQQFSEGAITLEDLMTAIQDGLAPLAGEIYDILAGIPPVDPNLPTLIADAQAAVGGFYSVIAYWSEDIAAAAGAAFDILADVWFFVSDDSNPAGFDLFYSDDGKNFHPYTVNGFGDENNYGGRVLLPTGYGLFVLTANPFTGCQVWLLDDVEPEITLGASELTVKVGKSVTMDVRSLGLLPDNISVALGDGTVAEAKIELVRELRNEGIPAAYWSSVRTVAGPLGFNVKYEETSMDHVPVYLYRITVTGLEEYEGPIGITVSIGDMIFGDHIELHVIEDFTPDTLTVVASMALLMAGIFSIGYFVVYLIRP